MSFGADATALPDVRQADLEGGAARQLKDSVERLADERGKGSE